MRNIYIGIFGALILSAFIVSKFYNLPLRNLNTTYFASDGDGLKDYTNTLFYVKYDTTLLHSRTMNYPYGEHVFFTGNQPSVSFILKFINTYITDISDYIVGTLNAMMLLSIVLGTVFLYLLMIHFKLPVWYSLLTAIGITFLSPQIARLSGHFSLSYVFAIPAMLYMVAKFHERPRFWLSGVMGVFVLWALGTHIYMLGFYAFVVTIYWLFVFVLVKDAYKQKHNYVHLALQFLIPLFSFLLVVMITDQVADRSSYPYGFLAYRAYPEGVFLPLVQPYASFIYKFSTFHYIPWEGTAYVGLISAIGFIVLLYFFFKNLAKGRLSLIVAPSSHFVLNVFFWVSVISLLYSFGIPFIIGGMDFLIQYIGPLKQMRGTGRFTWIFFYVINIFIFYKIWHLKTILRNKTVWIALIVFSLSFLWYDAYLNIQRWSAYVNNPMSAFSDYQNQLDENQWVHQIDVSSYQATIPLPYFHVGSENIWLDPQCGIMPPTLLVSAKTGLPTMGVMLSRTSISQTLESVALFSEPYRNLTILDKMDSTKNFLLIVANQCPSIPPVQQEMIKKSKFLFDAAGFSLYDLPFDSLVSATTNPYYSMANEYNQREMHPHESYLSTGSNPSFITDYLTDDPLAPKYYDLETISGNFGNSEWIYYKNIPNFNPEQDYILSIWMHGIEKDLFLRSTITLEYMSSLDVKYGQRKALLFRALNVIDGNWGLIELPFRLKEENDMLRWRIQNNDHQNFQYTISHVMVRPSNVDIYKNHDEWIMKNNRFYTPGN
jgi:hypothetical protein